MLEYLGDEVADIWQNSSSGQVDLPVRRLDEFLVEGQVLCSTLPCYAQFI